MLPKRASLRVLRRAGMRLVPMNAPFCPHCVFNMRHGVRLTSRLVEIYDAVDRAGAKGAHIDALVGAIYPGKPAEKARFALKANIIHLNNRLAATDIRVRNVPPRSRVYQVVTVGEGEA